MKIVEAAPARAADTSLYAEHVNPQWVRLLDLLGMNAEYVDCQREILRTADGRTILDFLSGYCVYNAGHNHPGILRALQDELSHNSPSMLQSHVAASAGELAAKLCARSNANSSAKSGAKPGTKSGTKPGTGSGGRLTKVYFCSSGSEGVETAIKFARAFTGRDGLIAARGAFHGLTCGALALMDHGFWSHGFGPLLPGVEFVDFGNLQQLEKLLATRKYAALVLEPVQGEGGIVVPAEHYLARARALCHRYGTLFVLDEVQTGLYRTGPFLAAHHYDLDPDIVILAKALSGGLVPVGAVLMTDGIYDSVYGSLRRSIVHTSTYSENSLAMRAGLATLEVLEEEELGPRAFSVGEAFREQLREALAGYEMVAEVRGLGFFSGIVFRAPRSLRLRLSFEAFHRIHPAMFGQMLVMRLYREHGILTQICGNNFMVLKAAPPLNASQQSLDSFTGALKSTVETVHSSMQFWQDALGLAARAVRI